MQEKTCCFTGHRKLPEEQLPQLKQALFKVIVRLASQGVTRFACGGALGFDTLAAQMVFVVKETFLQNTGQVLVKRRPKNISRNS